MGYAAGPVSESDRTVIAVSDLHLSPGGNPRVPSELAALIERSPHTELVIAGDALDLSMLRSSEDSARFVSDTLSASPRLTSALRGLVSGGGKLTFVAGNHDAPLMRSDVQRAFCEGLELPGEAPVAFEPWFIRRHGAHIEHGHAFDPDNAPAHPLASWAPRSEPVGIALTRRFLVPSGALSFKHAHQTTPLGGLLDCFKRYGSKAPKIVGQYFWTAAQLCWEARSQTLLEEERRIGRSQLAQYAEHHDLAVASLSQLVAGFPAPRHQSPRELFFRLYFDRTLPTASLVVALPFALAGSTIMAGVAAASFAVLAASLAGGVSRYDGDPEARLLAGAELVRKTTGANHVVLGHTHREEAHPGYTNLGSFAFSHKDAHSHVVLTPDGLVERRVVGAAG